MAETQTTGMKNADELITLAAAFGLTVTVETTDRETLTSYVVRFAIPVPVAYAGTELGRAIAGDTVALLWTKAKKKGARGRLIDATIWSVTGHRKVRTLREVNAAIDTLGHDSAKHARAAAPLPEDVVDAPHALYIDGQLRLAGIPAERVRTFVKNRRFNGRLTHQDADGAIICDTRRYAPIPPAPAEERQHVRIVNGGAPEVIDTRTALDEINHAMMDGKRDVRTMSAARSTAHIVYKDPARGTVDLRPATPEEIASDDAKTRRRAAGFAAKWWAEHHTEEPTDEALCVVFAHCVKPPRPEMYPAIREAISANTPPAAAAPLFTALAAYEAVSDASLSESPRDLHMLACHLETLPLAAHASLHAELRAARDDAEEAWEALRTAEGLPARTAARNKTRAAIERARAAVLDVDWRAERMRGTYVPPTAEEIRAAARAYMATMGTTDELAAIETGTPSVRVDCRKTLKGEHVFVRITAVVNSHIGRIPAHPPVTLHIPYRDGRMNAADNARKALDNLFRVDVPVEYAGLRRV